VPRLVTGIDELDRVTGGGLVPGSALLVGGDPGIGKSTLLLQATGKLAARGCKTAYISGEESVGQVRRRAKRLEVADIPVSLASETSLGPILDGLMAERPDVVIIDSIQTLWTDQLGAAPGTVAQVRACSQELTRFAKRTKTALAQRMKSACLKCARAGFAKCPIRPRYFWMAAGIPLPARLSLLGLKARGLC